MFEFFVASDTENGGIYRLGFDEEKIKTLGFAPCERPAYIAVDGGLIHVLLRAPYKDSDSSGVVTFDSELKRVSKIIPTGGPIAAHLCVRGGKIYVANYISGDTTILGGKSIHHVGHGPHPTRQLSSHPHMVTPTPDGKYLAVCDLGCDHIHILSPELEIVSETVMPSGCGPRHIVFSPDGKYAYCANELSSTVTLLAYDDGKLTPIESRSTIPEGVSDSFPATIRFGDGQVLVSNRGHDSIAVFDADGGRLSFKEYVNTHGHYPRDFVVSGGYIAIANERSDKVVLLGRDGRFMSEIHVDRPLCVLPR